MCVCVCVHVCRGLHASIQFIYFLFLAQNICINIIILGKMRNLQSLKRKKTHFSFSIFLPASMDKLLSLDAFHAPLDYDHCFLNAVLPLLCWIPCLCGFCYHKFSRNLTFRKVHGWKVNFTMHSCMSESVFFILYSHLIVAWPGIEFEALNHFPENIQAIPPPSSEN